MLQKHRHDIPSAYWAQQPCALFVRTKQSSREVVVLTVLSLM